MITQLKEILVLGDESRMRGYSDEEIDEIASVYDISVEGQLRTFLKAVGKSDAGLWGPGVICLYRPTATIRNHILFQSEARELYYSDKAFWESGGPESAPFTFSYMSHLHYYFVRTKSEEPDQVWYYDEDEEVLTRTKYTLFEWLKEAAEPNESDKYMESYGDLLSYFPPRSQRG